MIFLSPLAFLFALGFFPARRARLAAGLGAALFGSSAVVLVSTFALGLAMSE
jgi:hypothetical protein